MEALFHFVPQEKRNLTVKLARLGPCINDVRFRRINVESLFFGMLLLPYWADFNIIVWLLSMSLQNEPK